jgi:hypothetical protein
MQAYGWSLPTNNKPPTSSSTASTPSSEDDASGRHGGFRGNVPVPVPVYCRPLMEKEPGMKVIIAGMQLLAWRETLEQFRLESLYF